MFKSRRWPLLIDPQNQANRFIKNLAKDPDFAQMGIISLKASDSKLMKAVEQAVQNGKWFLIENVGEELDPSLEPILQKQVDK
jgi:dynein heavy chain